MPYNKNNPYIARIKKEIYETIGDARVEDNYENLIETQKNYISDIKNYNPDDPAERDTYIARIGAFLAYNFAARKFEETHPRLNNGREYHNYDFREVLKDEKIDLDEIEEFFTSISEMAVQQEVMDDLAELEREDEEKFENPSMQEETTEKKEKPVKEEKTESKKESVKNEEPELIQINPDVNKSISDDEPVIQQPKKEQPQEDNKPVYVKDLRNELIKTFNNIDEIRTDYNKTDKSFTYAEYLLREANQIDSDAQKEKDDFDNSHTGPTGEPVDKKYYDKAMQDIKQEQFSKQLSVLFAGKACQSARRFWDYINPFKWGKMIAENNAINTLRDKIQNDYHLNDKEMKTYEKLYDLRNVGLPQDFMRVDEKGNVVLEGTLGGAERMPVNDFVKKVQKANLSSDRFAPDLAEYEERSLVEDTLAPSKSSSAISNQLDNDLNNGEIQNNQADLHDIQMDNYREVEQEDVKEV